MGDNDLEGGTPVDFAVNAKGEVQILRDPLDNGQAQSGRHLVVLRGFAGAVVFVKDMRQGIVADPDALVGNGDGDGTVVALADRNGHGAAVMRVEDGVSQQIGQECFEPLGGGVGLARVAAGRDNDLTVVGLVRKFLDGVGQQDRYLDPLYGGDVGLVL